MLIGSLGIGAKFVFMSCYQISLFCDVCKNKVSFYNLNSLCTVVLAMVRGIVNLLVAIKLTYFIKKAYNLAIDLNILHSLF